MTILETHGIREKWAQMVNDLSDLINFKE